MVRLLFASCTASKASVHELAKSKQAATMHAVVSHVPLPVHHMVAASGVPHELHKTASVKEVRIFSAFLSLCKVTRQFLYQGSCGQCLRDLIGSTI